MCMVLKIETEYWDLLNGNVNRDFEIYGFSKQNIGECLLVCLSACV